MSDSTQSIFTSARNFFSGTMLSRITGLLRDIAVAAVFGTGEAIAGFMVAFRFSHTPRRLLGEGPLQSVFVPHFEELRKEDPARAFQFFRSLSYSLLAVLILIVLISMAGLQLGISFFGLSDENSGILKMTLLMMPSLIFICLYGLNSSLLQCHKIYFLPSIAPAAFNLVWILATGVIWFFNITDMMTWLSFAIIVACGMQWLMTVPLTQKILKKELPSPKWIAPKLFSSDVRQLLKPLCLGILGVAASQINSTVDSVFARYADLSGPAYLWYAIRLQQLPLALFGIALSGALLPPLSRAIKNQDGAQASYFLEFAIKRTVGFMLPLTFALFIMGDACINIAYGRGDFDTLSITKTTQCLWGYSVGLIPMSLILVIAPAFYAQKNYRLPMIGSLLSVALNIVLNGWFIFGLGGDASSVAYATGISAWFNLFFLMIALRKTLTGFHLSASAYRDISKTAIMTLAASCAAVGLSMLMFQDSAAWNILTAQPQKFSTHFIERLANVCLKGIIFLAILIPSCRNVREEIKYEA